MLTKDLVRFKSKAGRIYPGFIDPSDQTCLAFCEKLVLLFDQAVGKTERDIDNACLDLPFTDLIVKKGLTKILFDRCSWEEADPSIEAQRYDILLAADQARQENVFESFAQFREIIEGMSKRPFKEIHTAVYADLSELKKLAKIDTILAGALIHRYNCALVQALLLQARLVEIEIEGLDLLKRRHLFRQLKFHRLLVQVKSDKKDKLILVLSGPLTIFDSSQSYGIRIANFFPHILNLAKYSLEAELENEKKGKVSLCLDHNTGIKSHYVEGGGYVPEEFNNCLEIFNQEQGFWSGQAKGDFVTLGKESYSFADITFEAKDKTPVFLELFHRWHSSQIVSRLAALEANPRSDLILGCDRSVIKTPELKKTLEESTIFQKQGFLFRDFPTPKQLSTALAVFGG